MLKTILLATLLAGALAAQEQPKSLEDLHRTAKQSVTEKNLDQALEQYKGIVTKDPKSVEALFNIGWIYNEQKKFATAVRWLKQAAEAAPQDIRVQSELGFALSKLNHVDGAIDAFTKATVIKPDSLAAWIGLGDANFELKKDSKAASAAYFKAIELGNVASSTYYRLGWCLNDLNQYPEAAAQLKKAAALEPKSATVWLEWGYALLRSKQYDEAVQALTRATVLDPKERLGRLYLGRTYLLMKNKPQVVKQIQELKVLDGKAADALNEELRQANLK